MLVVLVILLVVVGVGGTYWSLRHVYLSDKPAPIPEATAPDETSAAPPGEASVATASEKSAEVRERMDTMKQAARSCANRSGVERRRHQRADRGQSKIAWYGLCWHRRQCPASAVLHSAGKIGRSISKCIWSGRSIFQRHSHYNSSARNERKQRAVERGDAQRPYNSRRSAGLGITGSRKIAANLRDQICQLVWSNGWRNQGRQSNFAHKWLLIHQRRGIRRRWNEIYVHRHFVRITNYHLDRFLVSTLTSESQFPAICIFTQFQS